MPSNVANQTFNPEAASEFWTLQNQALMRLQLYAIGKTHKILGDFLKVAKAAVNDSSADGSFGAMALLKAKSAIDGHWHTAFTEWTKLFEGLRRDAASLPFGVGKYLHAEWLGTVDVRKWAERKSTAKDRGNAAADAVFQPQLQAILDAAAQRVYKDKLLLSGRIWNLGEESRTGIQQVLFNALAEGKSAWDTARELEPFLGAGQDCPRWTRQRLYGLTKAEIAKGDRTGLISGDACAGQGIAYKALRVARTEIQAVHNMATEAMLSRMPWALKQRMTLSPSHPEKDVCDEFIAQSEDGQGAYPIGSGLLPVHPHCLCYWTSIDMPRDAFVGKLRGWMRSEEAWPEMDAYSKDMGEVFEPKVGALYVAAGLVGAVARAATALVTTTEVTPSIVGALDDWITGSEATIDGRFE